MRQIKNQKAKGKRQKSKGGNLQGLPLGFSAYCGIRSSLPPVGERQREGAVGRGTAQ